MTPEECAAALKKPIGDVGFGFMTDPLTREAGKARGLRGRPLYFLGRGGALGDVPAEVVVAAFAFFPPGAVVEHWDAGRQVMPPHDAALLYAEQCAEWGRRTYATRAGLERSVELFERVAAAAEPFGLPLFVGWRALPRVDDAAGRLAQVMNVLREHRGSVHACAVAAVGLHPLEATVAGAYGLAGAQFLGWPEPYPDPAPHRAAWERAEELTSAAAARPFTVLTEDERADLAALWAG
ncbi:MAG: hypothetical protein LC789_11455 [Actinobacteria bacterium]|nr:hypothetical protein [Actinomycetota bacterium]